MLQYYIIKIKSTSRDYTQKPTSLIYRYLNILYNITCNIGFRHLYFNAKAIKQFRALIDKILSTRTHFCERPGNQSIFKSALYHNCKNIKIAYFCIKRH